MLIALSADAALSDESAVTVGEPATFPPFDPWHWESQAFWLVVIFALLYLVMSRVILPRFASTMERRGTRIATDLDEAARLNEEAEEAKQALEVEMARARARARETAAAARAKIDAQIAAKTASVEADIDQKLQEAEANIAELRAEAMAEVEEIAVEAARSMSRQLGGPADEAAARSAVKSVLAEGRAE